MAGLTDNVFKEKISPFLLKKISELEKKYGTNSEQVNALSFQYKKNPLEDQKTYENRRRHYEAEINAGEEDSELTEIERLYRRSLVIDITMICAAHCRYCLRGNYPQKTLSDHQLLEIAKFCGNQANKNDLVEVLITGGDPLFIPKKLNFLIDSIDDYAPNIKIIRIGSRLASHQPDRIGNDVLNIFETHQKLRFEVGTQINHPIEFFPEVIEAFEKMQNRGVKIYSQNVLLKNVNDNAETLVELYNNMRTHDIEPHYLFHSVPMKGLHHFRTTIQKGIDLIRSLTCSGSISGRVKPMFAAMTDIGKITFYEGVILKKNDNNGLLLQSNYSYEQRRKWVPNWKIPETALVDENGLMQVWYLDGED